MVFGPVLDQLDTSFVARLDSFRETERRLAESPASYRCRNTYRLLGELSLQLALLCLVFLLVSLHLYAIWLKLYAIRLQLYAIRLKLLVEVLVIRSILQVLLALALAGWRQPASRHLLHLCKRTS